MPHACNLLVTKFHIQQAHTNKQNANLSCLINDFLDTSLFYLSSHFFHTGQEVHAQLV